MLLQTSSNSGAGPARIILSRHSTALRGSVVEHFRHSQSTPASATGEIRLCVRFSNVSSKASHGERPVFARRSIRNRLSAGSRFRRYKPDRRRAPATGGSHAATRITGLSSLTSDPATFGPSASRQVQDRFGIIAADLKNDEDLVLGASQLAPTFQTIRSVGDHSLANRGAARAVRRPRPVGGRCPSRRDRRG